jgi:hypothetical protein
LELADRSILLWMITGDRVRLASHSGPYERADGEGLLDECHHGRWWPVGRSSLADVLSISRPNVYRTINRIRIAQQRRRSLTGSGDSTVTGTAAYAHAETHRRLVMVRLRIWIAWFVPVYAIIAVAGVHCLSFPPLAGHVGYAAGLALG